MSDEAVPSDHQDAEAMEPPPGKRLLEIMGRPIIVALAIGSVVGATLLCSVGIFYSTLVPTQIARFFLCLLVAFLFSVFVFTIYPSDYKLSIGKLIKIPFVLVGPAALWIALFLLLWNLLPSEASVGKLFLPPPGTQQIPYGASWALSWKPVQPVFYKVKITGEQNTDDPGIPAGFYVEFDPSQNEYRAVIGIGPSHEEIVEQYEVVFSRNSSNYRVEATNRR